MHHFIEFAGKFGRAILLYSRIAGITHDLEKPRAAVSPAKSIEESQRPQTRLLDYVFGIRRVAHQPARQVVRRVKMRRYDLFESLGHVCLTLPFLNRFALRAGSHRNFSIMGNQRDPDNWKCPN
jgi:hypothetical protein